MHGEASHGYVCQKCGWTFPNHHPSAKHRRAHKKICGKVAGFPLIEQENAGSRLAGSVDEHQSDENHNKVEEKRKKLKGIGGLSRYFSTKTEDEVFSDAIAEFTDSGTSSKIVGAPESDGMVKPSKDPSDNQIQCPPDSEDVKDQTETKPKEDHAISSSLHPIVGSGGEKIEVPVKLYPENTQIDENAMDFMQGNDTNGTKNIVASSSAVEALASKIASEEPEIDGKLKKMDDSTEGEMSLDVADNCPILMTDTGPVERVVESKEEETNALGQKVSQDELPHNAEGCNVKEVNENLPILPKHAHMHVEELSEMTVEDCKDHELLISEPDQIPDCSEAIREKEVHPDNLEDAQSGFLSSKSGESAELTVSEVLVLEDKLQEKEEDNKIIAQEVLAVGEADNISVLKDSKGLESDQFEAPLDATNNDLSFSQMEKDQMVSSLKVDESQRIQQDKSNKIVSETDLVEPAGGDTLVSSSNVIINEVNVPVSGDEDVTREIAGIDNSDSDITVTCIGGAIEKNLSKPANESPEVANYLSEPLENLKESESPLDTIVDSSAKAINENVLEPQPNALVYPDEDFKEDSNELEECRSVDLSCTSKTEIQMEPVGAERIAELPHEVTKLHHSGEVGLIQSCAEDPKVEESMPSIVGTGSQVLSSGTVEDNTGESSVQDLSDIRSQPLEDEEAKNIVKQCSDASAVVPSDWSVDSISQADSLDAIWGSVSDATGLSVKDASDVPVILAAETQPGTTTVVPKEAALITNSEETKGASEDDHSGNTNISDAPSSMTSFEPGKEGDQKSAAPEIQTVQNPQQALLSSETAWFPSLTQVVNESQGRKKNEEIIEKVASWNSGKSHTPLGSLLVEANLESKHKVKTAQSHPTPPAQKTDVSPKKEDDDLSAKPVNPTTSIGQVTAKGIEEKEWNSPARLPMSREKRKNRSWLPFMCCSSVK